MLRRSALKHLVGTLAGVASLPLDRAAWAGLRSARSDGALSSTWADHARPSRYFVGRVDASARPVQLQTRPHGVVLHPALPDIAYVCARRPGEYLWKVDLRTGRVLATAESDDAFRFEGHAIVDPRRSLVYTTQSDLEHGEGRIGIHDAVTLEPRGYWKTGGLGPHELAWLAPERIAVAHGGILTLPETGRVKRNLDTMDSSLIIIDSGHGVPVAQHRLAEPTMGIRHLAVAANGLLGIALQNEGAPARPVFAVFDGHALAVPGGAADSADLGNYGASVATAAGRFAVTCTRADVVALFDADGVLLRTAPMRSPSGVAASGDRFTASNEFGELVTFDATTLDVVSRERQVGRRWDNHLLQAPHA